MLLQDFDFDLPERFIAQIPLETRSSSKLLVLDRKTEKIQHHNIVDLLDMLNENDVLVFNKSRVIPARLTGDFGEIFLAKSLEENEEIVWQCLVRPGRKFPKGKVINLPNGVKAEVLEVNEDGTRNILFRRDALQCVSTDTIQFRDTKFCASTANHSHWFSQWLQKHGHIPQPPYVHKEIKDPNRYQTVFSDTGKSVAAPTAGLHFTDELLDKLRTQGVATHFVHLDVGLGTFLPVKTENILDHKMHSESFFITEETVNALNKAKNSGKRIIAVGTTSVRVLESCSVETHRNASLRGKPQNFASLRAQSGETNIFIYPGYQFKFVDALLTNFHTPKSTLLMLVSAFAQQRDGNTHAPHFGRDMILQAYEEAKKQDYRFYSFGDAMFIV